MLYLLFTADSFRESALRELDKIAKYRIIDENHNIIIADLGRFDAKKMEKAAFVYRYFPIFEAKEINFKDYLGGIHKQIKGLKTSKKSPTKLECFDVNCKTKYSAKDVEVVIGTKMEKEGYRIDIINPEILVYVVLFNSKCYSGFINLRKSRSRFINHFRFYQKKAVSRAEFKIAEAFDTFDIEMPKVAMDIGAAPGGWSAFLAEKGAAVISIDNGELDRKRINSQGVQIKQAKSARIAQKDLVEGGILQVRSGIEDAVKQMKIEKVDMLANDINTGGIRSSKIILSCSKFLKNGGSLIMTVKCIRRSVDKYRKEVEKSLGKEFRIVQWKVLPHNRQEITLFALKK